MSWFMSWLVEVNDNRLIELMPNKYIYLLKKNEKNRLYCY